MEEIKTALVIDISPTQLGYIEPGHGLKGKQRWLTTDDDLVTMYECYTRTKEIILWCFTEKPKTPLEKKPSCAQSESTCSKKAVIAMKISEVEELIKQLKDKHGTKYSVEQLNAWAHLLHVESHKSLVDPPDLPYFRGTKKRKREDSAEDIDSGPGPTKFVPSAAEKRVSLRSKCIEQLNHWHSLLEKGAISQAHFEDVQNMIMKDILD